MRKVMLLTASAAAIALVVLTASRPQAQSFAAPAGTVRAPDPNIPLYFEAASVPSDPGNPPGQGIRRQPGGRFNTFNSPARMLSPASATTSSRRWEGDPPPVIPGSGADHMMLATRTLLADRFKLKIHKETRELDIYALTMTGTVREKHQWPRRTCRGRSHEFDWQLGVRAGVLSSRLLGSSSDSSSIPPRVRSRSG